MLRKSVAILAVLLSFLATEAVALGLGRVSVESALNQPLRVRIEVLQLGDTRLEDVNIQIASPEDFQRFNIERVTFLNNIRFSTEATSQGNFVLLTTNQIVREPYLSFILETRWSSGRLLSEHTILLDLPVFEEEPVVNAPVRRPISTVLTPSSPQITPQVNQPAVAAPTSSAPSVQPVIEPEVIAPAEQEPAPTESTTESVEVEAAPEPESTEPLSQTSEQPVSEEVMTEESETPEEAVDEAVEEELVEEEPLAEDVVEEEPVEEQIAEEASTEQSPIEEPEPEQALEESEPETITTGPSDTLSDIALRVRPDDSVSIQQTMLAIQALNPDAFTDGNINRMRSGQVLRVPSLTEIQATDQREAVAEVARQNQQATTDVQPLAAPSNLVPSQDEEVGGQLSVVTGDPDAEDSASGAGIEDGDNDQLDQRIEELETQLALREEEADRARLEREELESRLAELDEQIAAAQEIIRLQDLQLAQLQQSLADAAAEAEQQAQQQAAATPPPVVTQPQSQPTGLVDSIMRTLMGNSMLLIAAVVIVILLLAVLLVRRNKAKQPDEEDLDSIDEDEFKGVAEAKEENAEAENSTMGAEFHDYKEADLDSELDDIISVGGQPEGEAANGDQPVLDADQDIYSQVDLLVQHEQFEQAGLLLQDAISENPEDTQLQLKQLEVTAGRGDLSAFEMQAEALQGSSNPEVDNRIDELRSSLAAGTAIEQPIDTFSTENETQREKDETASFLDDLGIDLDAFEDDAFQLTDDEPAASADDKPSSIEVSLDELPEESEPGEMDLTFDLVAEPGADEENTAEKEASVSADDVADEAIAEDVAVEELSAEQETADDIDADEVESFEFDNDSAVEQTEVNVDESEELDIESLEFDVETPSAQEEASTEPEEELDLETFSFDPPAVEEPVAAEEIAEESPSPASDDENALDFDFDKSEIKEDTTEEEAEEVETFDFDLKGDVTDTVVEKSDDTEEEISLDFDEGDDLISEGVATEEESSVAESTDDEFDFDLNELEIDENEVVANDVEIDLSEDDFLDVGAGSESVELSPEPTEQKDAKTEDVEFDFDDEFEIPEASTDTVAETPAEDDDLDFLADDETDIESFDDVVDSDLLSDEDETATKLELAYAYQKMGDGEGAREILQEVIAEGSEAQIKEARDLIETLDSSQD